MPKIQTDNYDIIVDGDYTILNDYIESLNPSKIFVIVDENTEVHCLPIIKKNLHLDFISIRIPSGEKYKTIATCTALWQSLIENQCDRHSLIINLGGGVIGDMGGFVAGTYMRGIRFIQIPTTLLSQVDASVGGKLGVDMDKYKNMIGLFLEPKLVWVDTQFLQTLSDYELKSGYAEVIKHALIRSKALWNQIANKGISLEAHSWTRLVSDNIEIKRLVVKKDYKEGGLRKILNFGHTIGHAVESHYLDTASHLSHGEAIAIGMICEAYLSYKKDLISESELSELTSYIQNLYPENKNLSSISSELIDIMRHDKKNVSGMILFSLLDGIGNCNYDINVDMADIVNALSYYDSVSVDEMK